MRIPAPPSQKLNAELLLRDVRDRLALRSPHGDPGEPDPTDPAWLLLEQAAWMVERLSDQLDQYPFAALQQLFHLLGAELQPALPALGVVALAASEEGILRAPAGEPDQTRLFSAQTEQVGPLEFVLVEPVLTLVKPRLVSLARLDPKEGLMAVEVVTLDEDLGVVAVSRGAERPSTLFDGEELHFDVVGVLATNDTVAALERAIQHLHGPRNLAWLSLQVTQRGPGALRLTARITPERAVMQAIGEGPFKGGDLRVPWGRLNGTDESPPVCVGELPGLNSNRRGEQISPQGQPGHINLDDLPPNLDPAQLLRRLPQPMAADYADAIWRTVADLDPARLGALNPNKTLSLGQGAGEPGWVLGALNAGRWGALSQQEALVFELRLAPSSESRLVRVALVIKASDMPDQALVQHLRAFGLDANDVLNETPSAPRLAWQLPLPDESPTQDWRTVTAVDIRLPAGSVGLVLFAPHDTAAILTNAALVAQAPAVRDGRDWTVQRNVPEALTLLHQDVLSAAAMARAGDWSIPESAAKRLRALPLARLDISGGEAPSLNWAGVSLDGTAGQVTLNAPDEAGVTRPLRPNQRVTLRWYRRTDGRWGNLPAGTISHVEQEPSTLPRVAAVRNPLPTFHGQDREAPERAVERLLASQSALPVLPADFERLTLQVLGSSASKWEVRCWTYLERTLFPWDLWPLGEHADDEVETLREVLCSLGPEQVVITLGLRDPSQAGESFEVIRAKVVAKLNELSRRVPRLRGSEVMRLWPLTAEHTPGASTLDLPCFGADRAPLQAVDEHGRRATLPSGVQLLNAAVLRVAPPVAT